MLKDLDFLYELGLFFKRKRLDAGISQLQVAKHLGYNSAQFVSNWERGLAAPPMDKLKQIVSLYKADPDEVFSFIMKHQEKILRKELFEKPVQSLDVHDRV